MVRVTRKEVLTMKLKVSVLQRDIDEGKCGLASRCMEKLAVARAITEQLKLSPAKAHRLHVAVDGGHIRFNYDGYRWMADTPRVARNGLIKFDRDKSLVGPHRYSLVARRTTKIIQMTAERMEQINLARQNRIREGRPDRVYSDPSIHKRIVGYAEERVVGK